MPLSACDSPPPVGQNLQTQPTADAPRDDQQQADTGSDQPKTDAAAARTDDDPLHAGQAHGADSEHAQPKTHQPPASQPAATQPAKEPELPKYLAVLEKISGREPYRVTARIAGPRRLVIDTGNVQRIRIDRRKLELAPGRSVALHLDGQGIELLPSSTIVELERSRNGDWTPVKRPKKK